VLGLDSHRAKQVGELLLGEHWLFGGGGGLLDDGSWWRDLQRSCRYLTGVRSPDDYLRAEGTHRWANRAAPFNPLIDGPIGDELPVEHEPCRKAGTRARARRNPAERLSSVLLLVREALCGDR
jgi:hypothetical protein